MRIAAPVRSPHEVDSLIDAGATELYCGLSSPAWERRYGAVASSNRRYFEESSVPHIYMLREIIARASRRNVPVHLALNAPYVTEPQIPLLVKMAQQAVNAGARGIIIGDIALLLHLRRRGPASKLIMSTVGATFNRKTADFYRQLGISRIILPRHLTLTEMLAVTRTPLEYEALALFDYCINDDGFCTFHHGLEDMLGYEHACQLVNKYRIMGETDPDKARIADGRMREARFDPFCAACFLPEFEKMGITTIKMAGRNMPLTLRTTGIQFLAKAMAARNREHVQNLRQETFGKACHGNCNAYGAVP
jgi:putative protease